MRRSLARGARACAVQHGHRLRVGRLELEQFAAAIHNARARLLEVRPRERFKRRREIPERGLHALEREQEGTLVVSSRVVASLVRAQLPLVPRLVVVRLLAQHERLDRDEHLQHRRRLGVPELARLAPGPRAEKREADLAILVEVGVDAFAVREVVHRRRLLREIRRQLQIEDKDGVVVRCARRTDDEYAEEIDSLRVGDYKDARRQAILQELPLALRSACRRQPECGGSGRSSSGRSSSARALPGATERCVVMEREVRLIDHLELIKGAQVGLAAARV